MKKKNLVWFFILDEFKTSRAANNNSSQAFDENLSKKEKNKAQMFDNSVRYMSTCKCNDW